MEAKTDRVVVETNALSLRWSFGFNTAVPSAVHSLATPKRTALFYVSSHTGVIHDTDQDAQHLLQGHCNPITTVCVSRDKRWIATADAGDESMIVVWDSVKATPVKILSQPYAAGVAAMDMSTDSMFLVTLSHGTPQQIAIWEWTVATKDPAISAVIGVDHEIQKCVRFNGVDVRDIVSNGDKEVIFWNWTDEALVAFHPPRGISKLKKAVGDLTQSMFLPYTTKAVTSTSTGHVVLWDYPVSELVQSSGRDAIKILKISKSGIRLLSTVLDRYVVCGCVDGAVRFFDFQFRVVAWFEDIQSGQITSISFAETPVPAAAPSNTANVSMDDFQVPDFVVGTAQGKVILLDSKTMEEIEVEKRRGTLLVQGFDGDVFALDGHPHLPLFAVGTTAGTLQIWDIDDRVISASRNFMDMPSTDGHDERGKKKEATRKLLRGTKLLSSVGTAAEANDGDSGKKKKLADLTSGQRLDEEDSTLNAAVANAVSGGVVRPAPDSINNPYRIQCIKYAPHGNVIAVGFANGSLRLVSSQETLYSADAPLQTGASRLKDICSFKHSTSAIVDISWSADALYLATADLDQCVGLYRFYHRDEEKDKPLEWIFVGKYQSHYAPITSVYFKEVEEFDGTPAAATTDDKKDKAKGNRSVTVAGAGAASDAKRDDKDDDKDVYYQFVAKPKAAPLVPRLFSLGEDRVLQEYDVASCTIRGGLRLKSSCSVEQVGTPTAMVCVPGASGHRPASSFPTQWWTNTATPNGKDEDKTKDATTAAKKDGGEKKDSKESKKESSKVDKDALPPCPPDVFIMANDEYKLKVWQLGPDRRDGKTIDIKLSASKSNSQLASVNGGSLAAAASRTRDLDGGASSSSTTAIPNGDKVCRQTVLAPTYGGPINKLFMLPKRDGKKIAPSPFLVYSTFEKIVGLIKLPLDGNPNKAMALVAHPGQISCVVCSFDGKYLLTAGGADRAVNLWAVNTSALDASITLGGVGLEPYMGLLEGGKNGDFFQDLLDYFYYAQLRSQGLSTTSARQITGLIPLGEVVNLMRALGYYPTQQQVMDIRTEIELSQAHLKPGSRLKDKVDLEQFIKLYVNYRPVFGLNKRHFEDSFAALLAGGEAADGDEDSSAALARTKKKLQSLSRDELIACLQSLGERMSHDEIKDCLDALIGPPTAPGPKGTTVISSTGTSVTSLPSVITPAIFAQEVLGFDDYETEEERAEKERHVKRERDRAIDAQRLANEAARAEAEREARRGKDWKKEAREKRAKAEAVKKEKEDKRRATAIAAGKDGAGATDDGIDDDDDAIDWEGDPAEMGAFVLGKVVEDVPRAEKSSSHTPYSS